MLSQRCVMGVGYRKVMFPRGLVNVGSLRGRNGKVVNLAVKRSLNLLLYSGDGDRVSGWSVRVEGLGVGL